MPQDKSDSVTSGASSTSGFVVYGKADRFGEADSIDSDEVAEGKPISPNQGKDESRKIGKERNEDLVDSLDDPVEIANQSMDARIAEQSKQMDEEQMEEVRVLSFTVTMVCIHDSAAC